MNETAQVLRDAAEMILDKGLARGEMRDAAGRVCLSGAITYATEKHYEYSSEHRQWGIIKEALAAADRRVLEMGLRTEARLGGYGVRENPSVQWNNDWAKDADEVAHILKLTAEDVELADVYP